MCFPELRAIGTSLRILLPPLRRWRWKLYFALCLVAAIEADPRVERIAPANDTAIINCELSLAVGKTVREGSLMLVEEGCTTDGGHTFLNTWRELYSLESGAREILISWSGLKQEAPPSCDAVIYPAVTAREILSEARSHWEVDPVSGAFTLGFNRLLASVPNGGGLSGFGDTVAIEVEGAFSDGLRDSLKCRHRPDFHRNGTLCPDLWARPKLRCHIRTLHSV